MYSQFMMHG